MSFPAYTPKARVQKPAPAFSGTAVVDGTFEGAFTANCTYEKTTANSTQMSASPSTPPTSSG